MILYTMYPTTSVESLGRQVSFTVVGADSGITLADWNFGGSGRLFWATADKLQTNSITDKNLFIYINFLF